jgi:hypothetical protein
MTADQSVWDAGTRTAQLHRDDGNELFVHIKASSVPA